MDVPDSLPISMLNQFEYCPRRFWLIFVCGEMETNAPVLEGTLQHEHAHNPHTSTEGDVVSQRKVNVGSERLHLLGVMDVVEMSDGHLVPIEYKHGRMGKWLNDHIQLCAQAICLEERLQITITHGEIFYWGSRRRVRVEFTVDLRAKTETTVIQAFSVLADGEMPPPLPKELRAKCRDCSLQNVCLPEEVMMLGG